MIATEKKNIVGNGDIASVLPNQDRLLFFASGVSNSQETKESEYRRELDLLMSQVGADKDGGRRLVYFSSLSIFYKESRYTEHKRLMEDAVKDLFPKHTIIRIGNITWGTNPNTVINYFRGRLERGEPVEIRDEYRYVVDKAEFLHWISLIPDFNCEMNITGKRMKVVDIVEQYCQPVKEPVLNGAYGHN
jgi:nucleoside-diphosphate-sugar epimerase